MMKRTLINQIVRAALLVPMCLIAFSFVSCSGDDDDDDDITLTADTSADDTSDDEETTSSETSDDEATSSGTTYINGYAAVDLGLSVKWATCNVGADSPEDYGDYYAWGETETKDSYTSDNSVTYRVEMDDIAGNAEYDAATANWGSSWRMPTCDETEELYGCKWTWTTENDVNGYLVTGSNGNSIFLPAAGWRYGTSLYSWGGYGTYWSSTPHGSDTLNAYCLAFTSSGRSFMFGDTRFYGRSVRPVSE